MSRELSSLYVCNSMFSLHLFARPGDCLWRHAVLALDGAQPILADAVRVRARGYVSRAHDAGAGARVAGRRVQLVAATGTHAALVEIGDRARHDGDEWNMRVGHDNATLKHFVWDMMMLPREAAMW